MLDISRIPRIEFEVHNEELTNCIKELHFQAKTQEKRLEKFRKEIDSKVGEDILAEVLQQLALTF